MDKEIIEIYKERKIRMIELLETMDWEQAVKIVDGEDYQDRIDAICYPNGKKKEYEEEIGEVNGLYAILNSAVHPDPLINGKKKYARILIKRVGYCVYLGDRKYEYIYDNATEEELKDILNGKMSIGYI